VTEVVDRFDAVADAVHLLHQRAAALEAAKAAFAAARENVCDRTEALRVGRPGPQADAQTIALLRHLYWNQPEVPAQRLAEAAGFRSVAAMTTVIGPAASGVTCTTCGGEIPRTSRSWKPPYAHYQRGVECGPCDRAARSADHDGWALERLRQRHAAGGAVRAPAWEWMVAVELVRAYPPVATGVEPGSREDLSTGTWHEYDSSIFVGRLLEGRATSDQKPLESLEVAQEPASVLVNAARNVADWDTVRAEQLCAALTLEQVTPVLERLQGRIAELREQRLRAAVERFPDGHRVSTEDFPPWNRGWRATVRTLAEDE
jgi:hypothetical protein